MKKILCIIVVYKPNINLLNNNLKFLKNNLQHILIINNDKKIFDLIQDDKVTIINNNKNLGLAKAFNTGVLWAKENLFDYILFLDQDSIPKEDMIYNLMKTFDRKNIKMVIPNIYYIDDKGTEIKKNKNTNIQNRFVQHGISSGSIVKTDIFFEIGLFDERYFIDYLDFEFCFRLIKNKYKILECGNAILYQRLGNLKKHKIGFLKFYPTNHNYIRRYYMARNRFIIYKDYFKIVPKFVIKDFFRGIYHIILIIMFEKDKIHKIKYILIGIKDYLKGNFGKISKL